jgi:putative phage-type endonuclease
MYITPIHNENVHDDTESHVNLFESFTEKDIQEFEDELYDIIDNVMESEIINISKPQYFTNLIQIIINTFYDNWICAEICTEDDYPEIYDYIEEFVQNFFKTVEYEIPPRQIINNIPDCLLQSNITLISKKIEELQSRHQPTQRTPEWYNFRHNLITASNIYKAFGSDALVNSLIYEKCKPFVPYKMNYLSQNSRQWGTIFEPISIMLYEKTYGTKIADFGCIKHSKYSCIGASPDGINVDISSNRFGRMIEVKNIVNREITDYPKEEYWIQMQIQMETCDLDECDFIETRFKEFENQEDFYADAGVCNSDELEKTEFIDQDGHNVRLGHNKCKGVYLCFIYNTHSKIDTFNDPDNVCELVSCEITNHENDVKIINFDSEYIEPPPKWIYMPLNSLLDKTSVNDWIQQQRIEQRPNYVLYSTHYWYLDEFSCILVKRNRLWFQTVLPKIQDVWTTIEKERESGYEHRATKSRLRLQNGIFSGSEATRNQKSGFLGENSDFLDKSSNSEI